MSMKRQIGRDDILSMDDYARVRQARRREVMALKRNRRVEVGPLATFYFENYDTMWAQIHEMLWIEKGGEQQIADELAAYNPLIPQGSELVATLMFEIEDERRRKAVLSQLGGVERTITLEVGGSTITAVPEEEEGIERTTKAGKTSSVHFLRFPFTPAAVEAFRDESRQAVLGIGHESYAHMAVIPKPVRQALLADFD